MTHATAVYAGVFACIVALIIVHVAFPDPDESAHVQVGRVLAMCVAATIALAVLASHLGVGALPTLTP